MSFSPDDTIVCPYNKAHMIILSRMQFHLAKCRVQHPNAEKVICPFNSTHVVNKVELQFHMEWCQDRITGEREFFTVGSNSNANNIPLPTVDPSIPIFTGEVWGEEEVCGASVLDSVRESIQQKPTLVNKICVSKSVRKQHKLDERRRFASVIENINDTSAVRKEPANTVEIGVQPQPDANLSPPRYDNFPSLSDINTSSPRAAEVRQEDSFFQQNTRPVQRQEKLTDEGKKQGGPWQGWKSVGTTGIEESLDKIQLSEKNCSAGPSLPQRDRANPWRTNQPAPTLSENANANDFPVLLPVSGRGKRILH